LLISKRSNAALDSFSSQSGSAEGRDTFTLSGRTTKILLESDYSEMEPSGNCHCIKIGMII
jgi:hypothetical protein